MLSCGINSRFFLVFFCALLVVAAFLSVSDGSIYAQVGSQDVASRRAELQRQLDLIEQEIKGQQQLLSGKQQERVSLERDVAILDAKIQKARLTIKARTLTIEQLSTDITGKQATIGNLDAKLDREKESLGQILRKTNEIDDLTLAEIVLGNETVSNFFEDLDTFESVKLALQGSFEQIGQTKEATQAEKEALQDKRTQQVELRTLQTLEAKKIESEEAEKQRILKATKGQEVAYQKLIKAKEQTAAQIRTELFTLRDSAAIPFGQALDYATFASQKTNVRPALILGVLTQETRLGEYLGTGSWRVDMHPDRDRPVYLAITSTLGLDPDRMPVSRQPGYGWGGAMGPAQFIPSTWACYGGFINTSTGKCGRNPNGTWVGPWEYVASKDRIRELIGKNSPSNPWESRDAFMASAVLLMDNGADRGTFDAERLAALRYFAGWGNANKPAYAFYGDEVMEHAAYYQRQIDILAGS